MGGGTSIGDKIFGKGLVSDLFDPIGFAVKGRDPNEVRPLTPDERNVFNAQLVEFQRGAGREEQIFESALAGSQGAAARIPGIEQAALGAADQFNQRSDLARLVGQQRLIRRDTAEDNLSQSADRLTSLSNINPIFLPNRLGESAGFQRNLANQALGSSIPGQLQGVANNQFGNVGNLALQEAGRSAVNINPNVATLQRLSGNVLGSGQQTQQELAGLRQGGLAALNQAISGETPDAIANLFDGRGTAERDALESQFNVARQNITERGGQRGSALSQNLANVEAQRALALAESQARLDAQERQAGLGLFQQALGQGLSAPDVLQQAAGLSGSLLGTAGQQQLGAEGLRQSALGLGNQSFQGQGQFLNNAFQAGQQGLVNAGELARLSQAGLSSGIELNQSVLGQRAGLAAQDFQQRAQLAQQLGGGADNLLFGISPQLTQQGVGLTQLLAEIQGIPSNILRGQGGSNASSLLNNAGSTASSVANQSANAAAASNAALGQGLGSLVGALAGGFFTGGAGAGVGAGLGGSIGAQASGGGVNNPNFNQLDF
jgi:hypothetical protein